MATTLAQQQQKEFCFEPKFEIPNLSNFKNTITNFQGVVEPILRQVLEKGNIGKVEFCTQLEDVMIEDLGFQGNLPQFNLNLDIVTRCHLEKGKDQLRKLLLLGIRQITPSFRQCRIHWRKKGSSENWTTMDAKLICPNSSVRIEWDLERKNKCLASLVYSKCALKKMRIEPINFTQPLRPGFLCDVVYQLDEKIEEYVNRELKNHLEKAQDKFTNHLEWFWKGIGQQQAY